MPESLHNNAAELPGTRPPRAAQARDVTTSAQSPLLATPDDSAAPAREIGGPAGPEPTRFGDWEKAGRCIDF